MKRVIYSFFRAALLSAGAFAAILVGGLGLSAVSCTGYTDPLDLVEKTVLLSADKSEVFVDGSDEVTFTARFNGQDVTADAVIINVETGLAVEGGLFATTEPGAYTFTATYDDPASGKEMTSLPLTVTAVEASLSLSLRDYAEEGETRTFSFGATYGSLDVSLDEGLTVTEQGSETPLTKDAGGYYTVTTTGAVEKNIVAEWNGNTSPVFETCPMHFYKRVGILEFTGTWCVYCSNMAVYIAGVEQTYPDRNVMVAVHVTDALALGIAGDLVNRFKVSGLPAAILDFTGPPITQDRTSVEIMTDDIRSIVEADPAKCGLAISTQVVDGKVKATVKLRAAETAQYGLAVMLTEDGITGYPQKMPDESINPDYVHDHNLRALHQSGIEGGSLGEVSAWETVERTFEFDLAEGWNVAGCNVVVFATSGTGAGTKLLNAAECGVGETLGYQYERAL
ncbi:MAG: Omp28-related outer membrane protein [Alistipes sp.]|jgi:thiol-disulfide isomerase/thioredoxin|nr:Omp28-related outer membrane protein [Alistipes sp.]